MQAYREVVFEGSLPLIKSFLAGLTLGKGLPWKVWFSEECNVARESRGHRVLEALGIGPEVTHVVLPASLADEVVQAIGPAREQTGLAIGIHADRPVRQARFAYRYRAFNRELAQTIRTALAALPEGVCLEENTEEEQVEPSAHGAEGYAPEHDYRVSGRGHAVGPFAALLALREKLGRIEMVETETIELRFTD